LDVHLTYIYVSEHSENNQKSHSHNISNIIKGIVPLNIYQEEEKNNTLKKYKNWMLLLNIVK